MKNWDAIIIGAGCAGMASATALAEKGNKILVLEKRNILGGRACSYPDPQTGEIIDNGQHLLLGCYEETIKLLKRIGQSKQLHFYSGFETRMIGSDESQAILKTYPLPSPFHFLLGYLRYKALSWEDRKAIFRVAKALKKNTNLENISCSDWLNSLGQSKQSRERFWDLLILATLNISPEVAPANLLAVVLKKGFMASKAASRVGLSKVGLTELYAAPSKIFIEEKGGEVQTNQTVEEVVFENGKVAGVKTSDGETHLSKKVICTIPPSALLKIKIPETSLQTQVEKTKSLKSSPIASFHFWSNLPEMKDTYMGFWGTHFHWAFQKSKVYHDAKTKHWTLVASGAEEMLNKSKDDLIALAEKELALIPEFKDVKVSRAKIVLEREATWVPPLGDTSGRLPTKTSVPGFYFAGDWTDTGLPCTIESAVLSGHKAAFSVMEC